MRVIRLLLSAWIAFLLVVLTWSALSPPSWAMFLIGVVIGSFSVPAADWIVRLVKNI